MLAVKKRTLARRLVHRDVAMAKGCNLERKERKEKIRPEMAGTRKKSGNTSCTITTVKETV